MHKVNTTKIVELTWSSPKGKFVGASKNVSLELGRKPESTDLNERHPFDIEILRIPPGKAPYVYHSHSAQRTVGVLSRDFGQWRCPSQRWNYSDRGWRRIHFQ